LNLSLVHTGIDILEPASDDILVLINFISHQT
jgi:hypothetical protein